MTKKQLIEDIRREVPFDKLVVVMFEVWCPLMGIGLDEIRPSSKQRLDDLLAGFLQWATARQLKAFLDLTRSGRSWE